MCSELSNDAKIKIQSLNNSGAKVVLKEKQPVNSSEYFVVPSDNGVYKVIAVTNVSNGFTDDWIELNNSLTGQQTNYQSATEEGLMPAIALDGMVYSVNYYGNSSSPQSSRYITIDFLQTNETTFGVFYNCAPDCVPNWVPHNTSCVSGLITTYYTATQTCSLPLPANFTSPCPSCANWTSITTPCTSSDTYTTYYNNTNSTCTNPGPPPLNITTDCDYNNLGIIGNEDEVDDVNVDINIEIDNANLNITKDYNATKTVEIKDEDDNVIVEFEHDFSDSALNLRQILIKTQSSSTNYGYIIVNGISDEKTVRVEKIKDDVDEVCVEDREMTSISAISSDCDNSNEDLVPCPGNEDDYECDVEDDFFVVSGLTNSGVREYGGTEPDNCVPDWDCPDWSTITCINGIQTRTCPDNNDCGTTSGRPSLTQTCTTTPPPGGCTPDWECSGWSFCSNSQQTRTCTDSNSCGTQTGKPEETRTCNSSESNSWLILIIALAVLIILIVIILIIILLKRKNKSLQNKKSGDYSPPRFNITSQGPPRSPPMTPRYPIQINSRR